MSLSDLASLGSLVSSAAVIASLVFLYHQLRQIGVQISQAEKNQRASIRTARASRTIDNIMAFIEPSAADAVYKGLAADDDLTPTQLRQFTAYSLGRFYNAEEAYSQYAEGLLDEAALENLRTTLRLGFTQPGFRASWRLARNQFDPAGSFIPFIDGLLAETPATGGSPIDRLKTWMVEEKAAAGRRSDP